MNWIAVALAIFGLVFGLASAWFWEASSQVPLTDPTIPPIVTAHGPAVTANHLQRYLRRVSALNKWAAIFGAIGVVLSTLSGLAGSVLR